jgi:hypothetical protein
VKNLGGFLVSYEGETIGILHNNSTNPITIDISTLRGTNGYAFTEILEIVNGEATLEGTTLTISAHTSIILK